MTENATIPAVLADEVGTLAEERFPAGVECRPAESDLPGFDYFELFGTVETTDCGYDDCADEHGPREVRIGGRLVLTLTGGCQVELDEQETADVMWALANSTRRNRKAKAHGNNPEREARFDRQLAVMAKIAGSPA